MKHVWRALTLAAVIGAALTPVRPAVAQAPAAAPAEAPAHLVIAGDVTEPLSLQPAELKAMPRTTVTVSEEGREIKYEGVRRAARQTGGAFDPDAAADRVVRLVK